MSAIRGDRLRELAKAALEALQREGASGNLGAPPSMRGRMTGADLRSVRLDTFGWRQKDMANALEVSQRTYQRTEARASEPVPTLWFLAVIGLVAIMQRERLPAFLDWLDRKQA